MPLGIFYLQREDCSCAITSAIFVRQKITNQSHEQDHTNWIIKHFPRNGTELRNLNIYPNLKNKLAKVDERDV